MMTTMHATPAGRASRGLRGLAAIALSLALTAGCAADTSADDAAGDDSAADSAPSADGAEASPSASDPPSPPAAAAAEVPEVLRFEARTVDGAVFEGASVAGRPVVLWFWAPWCAVCRRQAPEVSDLVEEYGETVAFLGVGSLDSGDAIEDFAQDVVGPVHLSDPDGDLYQRFGIVEQSSFVVLDAQGDEVLRTGYADDDALAETVQDLAS